MGKTDKMVRTAEKKHKTEIKLCPVRLRYLCVCVCVSGGSGILWCVGVSVCTNG